MLECQNKQMAIEFGFKQRNGMRQLHINRGVILELGLTGLMAGPQKERAGTVIRSGENSAQFNHRARTMCQVLTMPCAED